MEHIFKGKWITTEEFSALGTTNVFHKQLEPVDINCDEHRNRHILFRKSFELNTDFENATAYISADDYYKLYVNGRFVAQGPAPSFHFQYNYNVIDIAPFLKKGRNVIAVHTLYQGLVNRVWQSADGRHGLLLDVDVDGVCAVKSDESFLTAYHGAYTELGETGYRTQFLERYDSRASEVGFEAEDFDDGKWANASLRENDDHTVTEQKSKMLVFERIEPQTVTEKEGSVLYDFGANYVGYLCIRARGKAGAKVIIRQGQELSENGELRFELRANCRYEEEWLLADGESVLDQFDYKSFRYAELILDGETELCDVSVCARHYPFELKATLSPSLEGDGDILKIWKLCLHTQKYGVQEVIQDCMEREKGFYLGDGCYTALTNMLLTHDDSMVRKLIDDAFATDFVSDTLLTCMNCSFMQEIAEYPLILVRLVLWHYKITGDKGYLSTNLDKVTKLLDAYGKNYETDGLLRNVDKWCVVEWPKNFQHGYDVDITEGKVCKEAHVSLNAYYIWAILAANEMAGILGREKYRDESLLLDAFARTFYDEATGLYRDGENTRHTSLVGNCFVYAFGLYKSADYEKKFLELLDGYGTHSLSLFCVFPILMKAAKDKNNELLHWLLTDKEAWLRMIREGATTTFEGWGRDSKWNTSLFHLTFSYAASFMTSTDVTKIF